MVARLKTEIWVQAFLRQAQVQGKFGAVLHRGHAEAGALYVVINHLNGSHTVLGPPPGSAYDDSGERRFENLTPTAVAWPEASEKIRKLRSFDSDIWVIEVEDRDGLAGLKPEVV